MNASASHPKTPRASETTAAQRALHAFDELAGERLHRDAFFSAGQSAWLAEVNRIGSLPACAMVPRCIVSALTRRIVHRAFPRWRRRLLALAGL